MRPPVPKEHEEQAALVEWLDWQHPTVAYWATPNGGHRDVRVAVKLKAEGVKPGVPDLFIAEKRRGYSGLFIEMKRRRGGQVSPEQREWKKILEQRDFRVEICAGFEAAKAVIEEYLG